MAGSLASAIIERLNSQLINELNEIDERDDLGLQFQLGLLERELGLMLSVLHHIESLEGSSEEKKVWAKNAREVVRSVEDMIDTFMMTSEIWKRYCLCFGDLFLGLKLSYKIKRLIRRIDTLNSKRRLPDIEEDGEAEEERVTIMSLLMRSVKFYARNSQQFFSLTDHVMSKNPRSSSVVGVGLGHTIGSIGEMLSLSIQILNVREDQGGGDTSREENLISETNTIISSFLKEVEFVLSAKFLFVPFSIWEVEQVRDDIKCLYDLLKDMEGLKELDEREKVWVVWVREILLPANDFLTSFKSEREQQMKRWSTLKAPIFLREDLELNMMMSVIRRRIQYAYGRRWIYGMGEYDESEGLKPSRGFELESIWRDLRLMRAFIKDVEGVEDQSKRVGVWLKQMKGLAREVKVFSFCIQRHQEKMKGDLPRLLLFIKEFRVLPSIQMKMVEISSMFLVMSERKRTYDIGKLKKKRGQCSRNQDLPGTSASVSDHTIVENDNNNLEEPGSSQQYTKTGRKFGEIEEISSEDHIMSQKKKKE